MSNPNILKSSDFSLPHGAGAGDDFYGDRQPSLPLTHQFQQNPSFTDIQEYFHIYHVPITQEDWYFHARMLYHYQNTFEQEQFNAEAREQPPNPPYMPPHHQSSPSSFNSEAWSLSDLPRLRPLDLSSPSSFNSEDWPALDRPATPLSPRYLTSGGPEMWPSGNEEWSYQQCHVDYRDDPEIEEGETVVTSIELPPIQDLIDFPWTPVGVELPPLRYEVEVEVEMEVKEEEADE
ncbi:hypothetical protein GQ44DRAFT_765992 [Phaeosphaeriaceae sp. PMI808]|nr:hypothetical protein GQ44DRAFT_765992 [Phaeosphaeriaceae sp. PMI808]